MLSIIAEVSANHNGSLKRAMKTIDAAAFAGADAVKFQTFTPERMAIPGYKVKSGPWEGKDLVDLYKEAHTPLKWHKKLFDHAISLGILPFSTPFDSDAVDLLESIECQLYKVASFELIDLPLVAYIARTGKPMVMSTGMAEAYEIRTAVSTARGNGCKDITLLHCVSEYPAKPEDMNLKTIKGLEQFGCDVGLSDHTLGTAVSVTAVGMGATFIEKHITLSRKDGGLDSGFSMEPEEFKHLVDDCRIAHQAIGSIKYGMGNKDLRRSLYYNKDIPKGTLIEAHHIKTARPALGLSPLDLDKIIGTRLGRNVNEHDPV